MLPKQEISSYIQSSVKEFERALRESFPDTLQIPQNLRESMEYSLFAGGKRMRPVLLFATMDACAVERTSAFPVACAIEWIHTYSLIHDDLPAMDDDDMRRGMPTNHIRFGEAIAILAGDALLTQAFELVTRTMQLGTPPEVVIALIRELAIAAGPGGMVGGQVLDLASETEKTDLKGLEAIHTHKTGDLIVYALRAGGWLAGASEVQMAALTSFGSAIGLAFQIQDDLLDVIGDAEKIGKPLNSDEKNKKATYPALLGIEEAKKRVADLTDHAKSSILQAGFVNPKPLIALADYLLKRDH